MSINIEKLECEKFAEFYNLLQEGNKICNLTTILDREDVFIKHFLDSILPEEYFEKRANCIEIGSGAGFPSIPLMICREDLKFTLIESIQKKVDFLKQAVHKLQLNAVVLNNRAEVLAHKEQYREKFDICTARAVAKMVTLVEYCLPFIKIGGKMIAYKANIEKELQEAQYAIELLGGKIIKEVKYSLPKNMGHRTIIIIEKVKNTEKRYPRGKGKERAKPLLEKRKIDESNCIDRTPHIKEKF